MGSLCLKDNEHGGVNSKKKITVHQVVVAYHFDVFDHFNVFGGGGFPTPKPRYNVHRLGPAQVNTIKHLVS